MRITRDMGKMAECFGQFYVAEREFGPSFGDRALWQRANYEID